MTEAEKQKAQPKLGLVRYLTPDNAKALMWLSVAVKQFTAAVLLVMHNL